MRKLEELDHESSVGQRSSVDQSQNQTSAVDTKCDCDWTVDDGSQAYGHQSWTSPAAEADDSALYQTRANTSLSSSGVLVTTGTSLPSSCENLQNKSHKADKGHQTELSSETLRLKAEVDSFRAELRRSDDTVSLLKRHIELNTSADGSPLPSFSPDVIVALAQEVERLNAELDKLSAEGGTRERASETEPASGNAPSVSGGHELAKQGDVRSTSPVSVQSLDTTLTDDDAAVDDSMRQKSSSVNDLNQLSDELVTKDALPNPDRGAAGDRTTTPVDSLSAACFNITGGERSFLESPAARNILRQSFMLSHSPFESTDAANQKAFAELQMEVERLRRRLKLMELENSRLLEHSARESVGPLSVAPSGRPSSINPQADTSMSLDGSLVKCSASGDVTMAAGFLKKLVNVNISILYYLIDFSQL